MQERSSAFTKDIKVSPFSLTALLTYPDGTTQVNLAKLLWLIKLRWLAILSFLLLCFPGIVFGFLDRQNATIYIGLIAVLLVFNLFTHLYITDRKREIHPLILCFQLGFDLVVLSMLLFVSGGYSNPFVNLFFLNAVLGGLLIPSRFAWPFVVLIHTLLGALQFYYYSKFGENFYATGLITTMFSQHILLFSFWLVMRSLGAYLEGQNERRLQARVLFEKQDRLRAIGALTAGFSHEFSSPLHAAKLRLQRLSREKLSESQSQEMHEAMSAIQDCEAVVKQMNSSQMDARDFHKKKVCVSELLKDILESWQEDHPKAMLKLDFEFRGDAEIAPVNFAQVVLNILDNAFEANPLGNIQVSLKKVGDHLVFQVDDEGHGFSQNILEKLGEPFNTNKPEGTGLGLYVSQLFAESLGGGLTVQNNSRGGAQVKIEWPQGDLA